MLSLLSLMTLPVMVMSATLSIHQNGADLGSLDKRAITSINCGLFATADRTDWANQRDELYKKGGRATAPANSCSRLGCYDTSGVALCNDNDFDISVDLPYLMDHSGTMISVVCGGDNDDTPISGQTFVDEDGGYNLIVGYCNGNDPVDVPPSAYEPVGPNGTPGVVCNGDDCNMDFSGTCDPDTITVDSQESVVCNEYLGATYVGSGATYTYSTTRTIGTTWTVGVSLGINIGSLSGPIGAGGFSGSYSETVSTGTSSGSSEKCGEDLGQNGLPGNWTCTMDVQPRCWHMKGTCITALTGRVPWENIVPRINDGDQLPIFVEDLCVCKNCAGWAEGGAPQYGCPLDCATCEGNP